MFNIYRFKQNHSYYDKAYFSDLDWLLMQNTASTINESKIENTKQINPYFDSDYYAEKYSVSSEYAIDHFFRKGELKGYSTCLELEGLIGKLNRKYGKKWFKKFIKQNNRLSLLDYNKLNDDQKSYEIYRSNLLDFEWYMNHYPDLSGSGINPLIHFSLYGVYERRNPNELFDSNWYFSQYLLSQEEIPFIHYLSNWKDTKNSPSSEFSAIAYLAENKDVDVSGIEPLKHYLVYGKKEGRDICNSKFDDPEYKLLSNSKCFLPDWYLNVYEDLRGGGVDPIEHYLVYGEREGRKPNPYFDPVWYKKFVSDDNKNLLCHYLNSGFKSDLPPSKQIDPRLYQSQNGIELTDMSVLEHYLTIGKNEGLLIEECSETNQSLHQDKDSQLVSDPSLRSFIDQVPVPLKPATNFFDQQCLDIHWVIPDFAIGAGGHMTIFRTIRWLEIFGHKNTIWIYNPSIHNTSREAYEDIIKGFQLIKANVNIIDSNFDDVSGDVIFATDWGSVNYTVSRRNFKRRFYFVQDHEPEFYAMGSYKLAAMETYKYDLDCICAGPWLSQLMGEKYNLWADHFWLSVDNSIYNQKDITRENSKKVFRIAFYSRHFTPRRAVELGLLALEQLGKQGHKIEVHTFGAPLDINKAPFKLIDHGICSPSELADIYKYCDLGIVFSATNYSLIPQEMMACGLPVAEIDTDSTRAVFPENVVTYLSPNPRLMCEKLESLLFKYKKLSKQADNATQWVNSFSWELSARIVESAIKDRLMAHGFTVSESNKFKDSKIHASIIIPTYNGGKEFIDVIDRVMQQKAPWGYEVVIVDSGSTDGTLDKIAEYPDIKLYQINSKDFQHGRTRNYAISKCSGEYVAVLTHDALPADEYWLYNIVSLLEAHPKAAGVFGRHFAYPHADPYTKRDLKNHFKGFDEHPIAVSRFTDETKFESGDLGWRQFLHFYSDNNSCMKKSVWEKHPYPEVNFGEDQAWADLIIREGYEKLYAKDAVVYHSHDFDEGNVQKRAFEEAEFFRDVFGYTMVENNKVDETIKGINASDIEWGKKNNLSKEMINRRIESNIAKISGFAEANL